MVPRILFAIAVAGLTLGGTAAQQAPYPQAPAPATQAPPQKPDRGAKPASNSEKLEKATENLSKMKASLKSVLKRVEDARNEKDIVKLNCVNEKLTQVKALLNVAEVADVQLAESVARSDGSADAEFQKISIAHAKIDQLRGEADQCIGQLAYVVDVETTVEVEQPANLPALDVTNQSPPSEPGLSVPVSRAPPASPWY